MKNLKANSSRWMGEQGINFGWQKGYGAFSVSSSHAEDVIKYIQHQHEHHKKRSFEEEFIALLEAYGVDYDPRYVFG
jgi:hypothetical protein